MKSAGRKIKLIAMKNILNMFRSAARPTYRRAIWLRRTIKSAVISFARRTCSHKKTQMEIYGDRARQYHIRGIRVVNKDGDQEDLIVVQNIPDGNCLFRAISQAVCRNEGNHASVRQDVVNYITGTERWKDYFPYIRGQHEHLAQRGCAQINAQRPNYFPKQHRQTIESSGTLSTQQISPDDGSSSPFLPSPPSPAPRQTQDLALHGKKLSEVFGFNGNFPSFKDFNEASKDASAGNDEKSSAVMLTCEEPTSGVNNNDSESGAGRDAEVGKKDNPELDVHKSESAEERELLRREYTRYMLTEKAYGTLQELVAAAEYFKFNLVVFREIPTGGFNVQTFSETKYDVTHCFLFTGHQEDGHFELMDRTEPAKIPIEVFNGSYIQVDHSSKTGLVTIRDQTFSSKKGRSCSVPSKPKKKPKGKKKKVVSPPTPPSKMTTPPDPLSVVEILPPNSSNQAVKLSSSYYDIPCRLCQIPAIS